MSEWFYAKGGAQQGPVPIEEIRAMLEAGTMDAQNDLVWNSTLPNWVSASQVPELSGSVVAAPATAGVGIHPFAYPLSSGELTEIEPGSEPIIGTAVIKRAFDLMMRNAAPFLVASIIFLVVTISLSLGFDFLGAGLGYVMKPGETAENIPAVVAFSIISHLISGFVSTFLILGATRMCLNVISGRPVSVGQLFGSGKFLMKAFGAYILYTVMIMVGFLLFIFPGIYLMLRFGQYLPAIVDKDLGIREAFSYSSKLTRGNKLQLAVVVLLTTVVAIAGCLALGIGLVFAYPMIYIAWVICYRWMQYGGRAILDEPGTLVPMLAKLPD
ncbi:DUF4339 domain-containing protein [Luteolibacter sp. AS25]|uniref:DUF4339 domain-containing protein n=1 Tax=Luteolibacter sp. AS25 TaxID=3135776 RepID=UPI00398ADE62